MNKNARYLFYSAIILAIFGIIMIYSASSIWAEYKFNNSFYYAKLQLFFFILGLAFIFIIQKLDSSIYYKKCNLFLGICFVLLILVLIPNVGTLRNGSRSWFSILGFGFQPSEISKVALIIFTSKYLSKNDKNLNNIKKGVFPLLMVIIIFFMVIMLEPDFGSAMVMCLTLLIMIFASGVKMSFFTSIGIMGLLGITGLIVVAPYRLKRIVSFINPWSDPLGSGFQIIQSLYAIGPGGLFGLGFGNSIQKQFYLPEPQTDFIFSIICEEFGILGAFALTFIFAFMFYQIVVISLKQENLFKKYLCFGLGVGIILQAVLNLCVVTGLIPITGVTLPFISYGGSSLMVSMISIGIILSLNKKC